ncbi:hypothetical protein [Nafulsella turpanensis]|uniref:hypothetical protein n=1 Tax=Nafulsella turpanensis TaxID=1265690 RepID=UPI00037487FC|nr:hypothetical protein [Nafulsella turpanensis]
MRLLLKIPAFNSSKTIGTLVVALWLALLFSSLTSREEQSVPVTQKAKLGFILPVISPLIHQQAPNHEATEVQVHSWQLCLPYFHRAVLEF